MLIRTCNHAFLLSLLIASLTYAAEDLSREAIQAGKDATGLVVLPSEKGFGSAFCVDPKGLFITNAHVVKDGGDDEITLVIRSGEEDEREVPATVVRTNDELDIAILQTKGQETFQALTLGSDKDLIETETVVAFGYPFGTALVIKEKKYPNISVNVGRVTAIRKNRGKLERIQVDAQLNPGNSGGPVINSDGEVIGVVVTGINRSGVSFAVPVSKLTPWLAKPTVAFDPPEVEFAKRFEVCDLPIEIAAIGRKPADFDITLSLGDDDPRTVRAKHVDGGNFLASIAPLEKPQGERSIHLEATFKRGRIEGYAADTSIRFERQKVKLSKTRSLAREGEGWTIVNDEGKKVTTNHQPSGTIQIEIAEGVIVPVELKAAREISVLPPRLQQRITYRLAVSADGKVVEQRSGHLLIKSDPSQRADAIVGGSTDLPSIATSISEPVEIAFSTPYDSFALGGGGRFFIFLIRSERKILVVDAVEGKVVKVLEAPGEGDLIAAGREKLFIVSPSKMMLQRWSLATLEREKVAQLSIKEAPQRALLGANSNGPLMLTSSTATLIDIDTLKPLELEGKLIGGAGRYGYYLTTSHQGQTFTGIVTGISGQQFNVMHLRGNRAITSNFGGADGGLRWVTPSADGALLFSAGGVFSTHGRKISVSGIPGAMIPTVDPRYFLGVDFSNDKTVFAICTTADCRKVWQQQGGFPELVPGRISSWYDILGALQIGEGWRVQYLPWANVVATLPQGNKKLILRRFDLLETLDKAEVPYLFVESVPPTEAAPGEKLEYQIAVRSKVGGLSFKLEDGPDGCDVSRTGRVSWQIPADFSAEFPRIIVSVRDRDGNELFHAFELSVEKHVKLFTIE